jgi:plastocyanin
MNPRYLLTGLLGLALSAAGGDVTGQAIITKRLTKKAIASPVYNLRGAATPVDPSDNSPVNEFDSMVVMLEGGPAAPKAPPVTATINQRNSRFDPELLVIPVGSTVQFPNFDPIFHNVFSLSKTEPFDLGFYPRGKSRTVKFSRSGIVQVYCHIHANMYAAIVVTSSPWYGKPNADGSFSFTGVPAGHYRVVAWHKVAGLHHTEVDVAQSGTAEVAIHIPFDVEPRP